MCVKWTGKWHQTQRSLTAYKLVKVCEMKVLGYPDTYRSPFTHRQPQASSKRAITDDAHHVGMVLGYAIGAKTTSRRPGIYLYRDLHAACFTPTPAFKDYRVIQVRVPAGTWVRRGMDECALTINATAVICNKLLSKADL